MSKELAEKKRILAEEPLIEESMWRQAVLMQQNFLKSYKIKSMASHPTHLSFIVPSSKCENPTVLYYKALLNQNWKTFDEYIKHAFQQFGTKR